MTGKHSRVKGRTQERETRERRGDRGGGGPREEGLEVRKRERQRRDVV